MDVHDHGARCTKLDRCIWVWRQITKDVVRLFQCFFSFPLFVHSQLYSTPLKLSSQQLLHSIKCSWQFFVPLLFRRLWVCVFRLLGGGIVHLHHTSWVHASTDNVEYVALHACILPAVSWCIPAWRCPTFSRHTSILVWFHNISYRSNLLWVCIFLSSIWLNDPHAPCQRILYQNRQQRGIRLLVWLHVSTTLPCLHIHNIHVASVIFWGVYLQKMPVCGSPHTARLISKNTKPSLAWVSKLYCFFGPFWEWRKCYFHVLVVV